MRADARMAAQRHVERSATRWRASLSVVAWSRSCWGLLPKYGKPPGAWSFCSVAHHYSRRALALGIGGQSIMTFFSLLEPGFDSEDRGSWLHVCVMPAMSASVFLRFIQCGGIGDPLAALLTREGIDDEMRGADQALLHRSGGLDAISSSMSASSMATKLAEGLGEHKCTCERGAWYSRRPQAYITAKSVRKRWQMSSSDPPSSCLSNSRANNTRMGTGRRPRGDRGGKRWAKLHSMAATRAAHGKVSAHWRRGWVSGTKSAT